MVELRDRVNEKDPSGTKKLEDQRAEELDKDLDKAALLALKESIGRGITDPVEVQRVVDVHLSGFADSSKAKVMDWIQDTYARSAGKAEKMVTGSRQRVNIGVIMGPRGQLTDDQFKAISVGVGNDIESISVDAKKKLTRIITEGIENGEGQAKVARRIKDELGMVKNRAQTVARTETLNAYRAGAKSSYERNNVEEVEWYAALDDRVCDECAALHEKKFPIDDIPKVHGGTNINCRCIQLPVIKLGYRS